MSEHVKTELADRVLLIRLNRADKKNALTQAMYLAMNKALQEAATNPEVRVVVLTGSGGSFTAGNDIEDFLQVPPADDDSPVGRFMQTLAAFPKPVIAAVNGFAIGVGVTLLLHCDLVYLAQGARLQLPFVNIGICPEFASTYLLPRFMGPARAAELVMFGEPFSAAQALEHGLATAVLADAEVERHALERARKLAQQPPHALRVTKQLMRKWPLETVAEAIREEAVHFIAMLKGPEAREAMTAFMQKRKPDFTQFK